MNALNLSKDDRVKLKPCPFCGGEAELQALKEDNPEFGVYISCEKVCDGVFLDPERAIAAWNRRHDETPSEFERLCGEKSHG